MIYALALFTYLLIEGLCQLLFPAFSKKIASKNFFSTKNKKWDTIMTLVGVFFLLRFMLRNDEAINNLDSYFSLVTHGNFLIIVVAIPLLIYGAIRLLVNNETIKQIADYVAELNTGQIRTIGLIQTGLSAFVILIINLF